MGNRNSSYIYINVCNIFFVDTQCSYYSLLFIIALYIFSYENGCISKLLKCRVLQNLAKISFEFYMVHELILILFRKVFSNFNYNWLIKKYNNMYTFTNNFKIN